MAKETIPSSSPSSRFLLYPDTAPKPQEKEDGTLLYYWAHYEERDKIDEEGHWRIEADSLSELITIIDNVGEHISWTYSMSSISLSGMPWNEDGIWHFEIDVGSWEEA